MVLVIDGFNLIYKFPHLEQLMYENKLNEARNGLISIFLKYLKKKKNSEIHLFFDGRKDKGSPVEKDFIEGIRIYYSLDEKADLIIKDFIKKNLSSKNLFVVSSDKDIIFYSKRYGCRSYKSEEFATLVNSLFHKEEEKNESEFRENRMLSKEEISYWADLFRNREN
ncbi:MAG: NYN domain-containing protein [Leptospiraceae bacterium]|nr:NYN domain-containing protein [Leptospiraceae bacterium]